MNLLDFRLHYSGGVTLHYGKTYKEVYDYMTSAKFTDTQRLGLKIQKQDSDGNWKTFKPSNEEA